MPSNSYATGVLSVRSKAAGRMSERHGTVSIETTPSAINGKRIEFVSQKASDRKQEQQSTTRAWHTKIWHFVPVTAPPKLLTNSPRNSAYRAERAYCNGTTGLALRKSMFRST